jgi:hemoglobin
MEAQIQKPTIETREDVRNLVFTFYEIIKLDEKLGPIFLEIIPTDKWGSHLEILTDFWMVHLFGIMNFKGNPVQAHRDVDKHFNYSITQDHFTRWLELWFGTIDSLFSGEKALIAKQRAQNMAVSQYVKVWEVKPTS